MAAHLYLLIITFGSHQHILQNVELRHCEGYICIKGETCVNLHFLLSCLCELPGDNVQQPSDSSGSTGSGSGVGQAGQGGGAGAGGDGGDGNSGGSSGHQEPDEEEEDEQHMEPTPPSTTTSNSRYSVVYQIFEF